VYFCFAVDSVCETVEDCAVCAEAAPVAQIAAKIDNIKILVLKV
jgi:hypothetical protein